MSRKRPNKPTALQWRTAEVRADSDNAGLSGYASHFGSIDSYGTAIKKGAFAETIGDRSGRISVLWNHWSDNVIGKTTELKEDDTGLWFNAEIVEETQAGAEVMALLRRDVPLGMSFGFETLKSRPAEEGDNLDWSQAPDFFKTNEGREYVRVIEEVRLWEISVVTFPANTQATIDSVRHNAHLDALTTLLEDLRSGQMSDTDGRRALLHQIVAALPKQPGPEGDPTPLPTPGARRRNLDAELKLLTFTVAAGD